MPSSSPGKDTTAPLSFALLKAYVIVSVVLVTAFAIANGFIVSAFLVKNLLLREGQTNAEYIQRVLTVEDAARFFQEQDESGIRQKFTHAAAHFGVGGDVVRANAYNKRGVIIWSTNRELVGRIFSGNMELAKALNGELTIHIGKLKAGRDNKPEHEGLEATGSHYVETYVPISDGNQNLVGVIESYRVPSTLDTLIDAAHFQGWALSVGGAIILYIALLGFVVRADRTIRHQQVLLSGAQAMLATNEAASAMAHNIRNPLASIRSSAELAQSIHGEIIVQHTKAIIRAVDRIEHWIRELMKLSAEPPISPGKMSLREALTNIIGEISQDLRNRSLNVLVDYGPRDIHVHGDQMVFSQVIRGLIANASEASESGGKLEIRIEPGTRNMAMVSIQDFGSGISEQDMKSVFRPFFSTKKNGMGMGLFLAKRVLERMGGSIRITSKSGAGARVEVGLRIAD